MLMQALRTDKEKEAARHEEEGQEFTDRHNKDMQENGQYIYPNVYNVLAA